MLHSKLQKLGTDLINQSMIQMFNYVLALLYD